MKKWAGNFNKVLRNMTQKYKKKKSVNNPLELDGLLKPSILPKFSTLEVQIHENAVTNRSVKQTGLHKI